MREHRYGLAVSAAGEYPERAAVERTPLLSTPLWLPDEPIELDDIELWYTPDAAFEGITGTEPLTQRLLPTRTDDATYGSYSETVAALAAPGMFENRYTYRLLHADLHRSPHMVFGRGHYFDGIDVETPPRTSSPRRHSARSRHMISARDR